MWVRLRSALQAGEEPATHGGVVGQVWRGGPRQARLALALSSIEARSLDGAVGRAAGELLRVTGQADVIDAALIALSSNGDRIVTSDAHDLAPLAFASGRVVELIRP